MRNIKESVGSSRSMTPLQISERGIASKNKYQEGMDRERQEAYELPFKKEAERQSNIRQSEQKAREAAARYGLNPDMSPLKRDGVQAINTGVGYNKFSNIGSKPQLPQGGTIQDSYNRMGISGGGANAFKSFGGDFGGKLRELEAASNRMAGNASQIRINEMGAESKIKESERNAEIKKQEELKKTQDKPILEAELSRLKLSRPKPTKALMSDEEARQYQLDLKSWEERIAEVNRDLSKL